MEQLEETEEVDRSHKQQNLTQNAEGCITCKTKTDVNQNSFMSSYVLNKHQIGEIHYGMHIQNPKCFFPFLKKNEPKVMVIRPNKSRHMMKVA